MIMKKNIYLLKIIMTVVAIAAPFAKGMPSEDGHWNSQVVTLDHLLDYWRQPPGSSDYPGGGKHWKAPLEITLERGQDLVIKVNQVNKITQASSYSWGQCAEEFGELCIADQNWMTAPLSLETEISKLGAQLDINKLDPDHHGDIHPFDGASVELIWKNEFTGGYYRDFYWQFSYCKKGKSIGAFQDVDVNVQPVIIHFK
ncbi:MAG: hypothetical protein K2W97_08965 [Chthoniobacterales bacterium]|nr:hypothetical protein [Chthoniobacterales bacterium]